MLELEIKKGNLFDNLEGGEYIVHACNAQGVWGSGFAAQCRKEFPTAHLRYQDFCKRYPYKERWKLAGRFIGFKDFLFYRLPRKIIESPPWIEDGVEEREFTIINLITSEHYGNKKDSPETILRNTSMALNEFFSDMGSSTAYRIVSPRFNAGLFNVPWELTEQVIRVNAEQPFMKSFGIDLHWTVWDI